jgi:glucose-6-phosphate 1-dehydrogenase
MANLDNPLQETLIQRHAAEPCTMVIFGATGDLTHRKLIPALYNLAVGGDLPPHFKVVGFARREKTDEQFRAELEESNKKYSRQGHDPALWANFAQNIHYHRSEFEDVEGYKSLKALLDKLDKERGTPTNRLFYLASAPEYFDQIMLRLRESGLNEGPAGVWARVVCEKPFGRDLASARHLNDVVNATFRENDTYRIDHYLGKETAQNIMVLRFANLMFEPLWNSRFIDHVQITCAENLGMEGGRGAY